MGKAIKTVAKGGADRPAVHVDTIRNTYQGKVYEHHYLRSTYRDGGKVKHRTHGNLSHLPPDAIDVLRRTLQGERFVPDSGFEIRRSLPHGHVAAVLGSARRLGVERLLGPRSSHQRDLVLAMVVARVIQPASKLATVRGLQEETQFTSLGDLLQVGDVDEEDLYAALDWLGGQQARIERQLAKRHLAEGCLVLYDLTSAAYTGSHCSLANFGFPREGNGRHRYRQVRIGLVCTQEGIPVAVEVFPGNTVDSTTVRSQVEKLRERFKVRRVVLVGDRGVLTDVLLKGGLASEGLGWIAALRAPAIRALVETGALQLSLFDQKDLAEITSPDYPRERLIACRNPLLAEERARKREEMLRATEKKLDEIVAATQRTRRRLRGEAQIGLRVGAVVNKQRMGKHFRLHISDDHFSYERDTEHIQAEAALDGVYVIRTSVPAEEMAAEQTVRAYKGLAVVEHAFRSLKSVDLKVRPFYHHLDGRVKEHVFLCMLAYYVEWHMRQALAPILFDDDDREAGEAMRRSVVAPAQRSPQAKHKAQTKRTSQGEPVHSFQTLLLDLATIAKNTIVFSINGGNADGEPTVVRITTPTPTQRRAFELLHVALK
jgi:hypothetical protein